MPSHFEIDGNKMTDFLTQVVFRPEQQPIHGIEVEQMETSLSFSETKSLIRVQSIEKWNCHYNAYPADDHYIHISSFITCVFLSM